MFLKLKYDLHYKILNAKDYGIPQNRNRLFLIGFKNKTKFLFPKPIKLKYKMADFQIRFFYDDYAVSEKAARGITNKQRLKKIYTNKW